MFLNPKDIVKIQDVLEKFTDVETFELTQENKSGIGSITMMSFEYLVNSTQVQVSIEISGVEDW